MINLVTQIRFYHELQQYFISSRQQSINDYN